MIFYFEELLDRCCDDEPVVSADNCAAVRPMFMSVEEAAGLGFAACARALERGETLEVSCGWAMLAYDGTASDVMTELRSGLCERVVRYMLADFMADARLLLSVELFAEGSMVHDNSPFVEAAAPAIDVTVFNGQEKHLGLASARAGGAINEVSGRSLAGVVARACKRLRGWREERLLALFSSPKSPFVLQMVDTSRRSAYLAFLESEEGAKAFPTRRRLSTTYNLSETSVRLYVDRCKRLEIKPEAEIDVFVAEVPLLAVFSLVPGVLEQCSHIVKQVMDKHPRDDLPVPHIETYDNVATELECSGGNQIKCANFVGREFGEGDNDKLEALVAASPHLSVINLRDTVGVSCATIRRLIDLHRVRVVALEGSSVADEAATGGSSKLLCNSKWRAQVQATEPLSAATRRMWHKFDVVAYVDHRVMETRIVHNQKRF